MSKIGKQSILLPHGVLLKVLPEKTTISGPLGELYLKNYPWVVYQYDNAQRKIQLLLKKNSVVDQQIWRQREKLWGTVQKNLEKAIIGVSQGYIILLKLVGLGYRAQLEDGFLHLKLGTTHPIKVGIPDGIVVKCVKPTKLIIQGINLQRVTSFASEIRAFRPPEPYKGKGIFIRGETIRRKEGKKKK